MKKQLPTDVISSELAESSVFFQKAPAQGKPVRPRTMPETSHSPAAEARIKKLQPSNTSPNNEVKQEIDTDVMIDVITSQSQDISLKQWQETIENTETQNSALRLTSEERYAVEDVVSELRRKYGIKTSMNEIARLGMLLLIADFKKNTKVSLIHTVKKA